MWWTYDELISGEPYDWSPAARGDSEWDNIDFHLDLGAGKLKKARLGIDKSPAECIDLAIDLETLLPAQLAPREGFSDLTTEEHYREMGFAGHPCLPFPANSIESIVSHHCLEHVGDGFIRVMDECYRVLKPGGVLRVIVPLFPSRTAVEDADHRRYFMIDTFDAFCGSSAGDCWLSSFSVPYTQCRFEMVDKDYTARLEDPEEWWGPDDARELRVALRKYALEAENAGLGDGEVQEGRGDAESSALDDVDGAAEARGNRELAGVA